MSTAEPIVSMRGVAKSFGELPVLRGIDLDVVPGEVVVLDRVSIPEKAIAMPASLSGGQQQRVAVARA